MHQVAFNAIVAIGKIEWHVHKASYCDSQHQ